MTNDIVTNLNEKRNKKMIPKDYVIKNKQLFRVIDENNKKFVCDYIPQIETIYYNERENQTLWTIKWEEPNGVHRLELVPKGTFATSSRIVDLYEKGLSVTSENARELVRYFQAFETMYKDEIKKCVAYDQLGYVKGGFLLPNQFVSADNRQDLVFQSGNGNADFVKGFAESGTLQEWFTHVFEPVKIRKVPLAFVLASIGSPLLNVFNIQSHIIDISYLTSAGKTITMKMASSVWGTEKIIGTWYSTFAGIERRAVMLNHLPYFIDDTKNKKFKDDELATLIYTLASGQERTRSGLKENHISRTWNNIIFSTGERKITEFSNDGGTVARVLAIHSKPIEHNKELVRNLEMATKTYYGTVGVSFLKWFVQLDLNRIEDYKNKLHEYETMYANQVNNPIIERTAKYMAFIRLVADMVMDSFEEEINTSLLDELWIEIVNDNTQEQADRPLQALKEVIELANRNKAKFYCKSSDYEKSEMFGEWYYPYKVGDVLHNHNKDQIIYFYPTVVKEYLKKMNYDVNTILKQWKERGYIKTKKDKNTLNHRSILTGNKITLFIAIDLTHTDLQEEAE